MKQLLDKYKVSIIVTEKIPIYQLLENVKPEKGIAVGLDIYIPTVLNNALRSHNEMNRTKIQSQVYTNKNLIILHVQE